MIAEKITVAIQYVTDSASARRALNAYTSISTGIAAAGVAAAGFAVSLAASLDEVAKTARSLDLTTEAYTELSFAADRSGVSQERLKSGLRALTMQIGQAAKGSMEGVENFKALGLSWENADGSIKTAADLLPEVADALRKIDDPGRAAALRIRLLGEGGADMATLLAEGSEGIDRLRERARELGLSLDSGTSRAAERLTDSMTDLKGAFSGIALAIGAQIMEPVADLADGLTRVLTASDGLVQVGLSRAVRALGVALDFAATPAGRLASGVVGVGAALGVARGAPGLLQGLSRVSPSLGSMGTAIGGASRALLPFAAVLAVAYLAIDELVVTAQGGDSMLRRLADSAGYGEETVKALNDTWLMLNEALTSFTVIGGEALAVSGELAASLSSAYDATEDFRESWTGVARSVSSVLSLGLSDMIYDLLPPMASLADIMDRIMGAPEQSLRGFRKLNAYMQGEQGVGIDRERIGVVGDVNPVLALATSARERNQREAIDTIGFGLSGLGTGVTTQAAPSVSVSVPLSVSAQRDAARDAGRETERAVARALAEMGEP